MTRSTLGRALALAVLALALLVAPASRAFAHAELESTSPAAGSVIGESPTEITLDFSEAVDLVPGSIRLLRADGAEVAIGSPSQDAGADTITADVPALTDGSYVVAWRAVSADSHPIEGAFTFAVGAATATDPALLEGALQDDGNRPAQAWLAVGRGLSYVGVALLVGGYAGLMLCARRLLPRRGVRLLVGGGAIATIGTAVMIAAQASLTVGSATAWSNVIESHAGRWWLVRLLWVAAATVAAALAPSFGRDSKPRRAALHGAAVVGSVALLAVVAAGGHGISGRWVVVGFLVTVVHLAAMSLWVGGVAVIGLIVARHELWPVARRFSLAAMVSVGVLAISGSVSALRQSSSWSALVDSRYGTWLLIKLVIVGLVLSIAGVSRWVVNNSQNHADAAFALRRTVLAECLGMVLILGATTGLVSSPPPHEVSVAVATVRSAEQIQGVRTAQLIAQPSHDGGTDISISVTSTEAGDTPIALSLTASAPDAGISRLQIPLTVTAPGHAQASNVSLPAVGTWTFELTARYGEFEQLIFVLMPN